MILDVPDQTDDVLGVVREFREQLFDRALRADPTARLEQSISHGFFGLLNWRETLLFTRLHDLDHAGQLGKIAAAFGAAPPAR